MNARVIVRTAANASFAATLEVAELAAFIDDELGHERYSVHISLAPPELRVLQDQRLVLVLPLELEGRT